MFTTKELTKIIQCLLDEFRSDAFNVKNEKEKLKIYLKEIYQKWDQKFPDFPERQKKKGSIGWKLEKSERSKYLINILIKYLRKLRIKSNIIINPACYTGKCAREIAKRLPDFKVIGTDINTKFNKYWKVFQTLTFKKEPKNYSFIQDNIFESKLNIKPQVVVFFGACGSVSDAIMDYAIYNKSPLLIFRTCCHDNIGGNTFIENKKSLLNLSFKLKNWIFQKIKKNDKGDYFSDKYSSNSYPRSNIVRQLSNHKEYTKIAQNSVDSELCVALIDLDRCCYLIEHGYDVFYKDELFFAHYK